VFAYSRTRHVEQGGLPSLDCTEMLFTANKDKVLVLCKAVVSLIEEHYNNKKRNTASHLMAMPNAV